MCAFHRYRYLSNILSGLNLYAKTQQVIFITTGERIRFLYAILRNKDTFALLRANNFRKFGNSGNFLACKQALRMGYSEICFRIARGRAKRGACNGPRTI